MIRIGIDATSGDTGEIEVCKAIVKSYSLYSDVIYCIFGNEEIIRSCFDAISFNYNNDYIKIYDAKEKIGMNDHPVFALRSKTESSIVKAGVALINNDIDVLISAGNTGALVALSQFYLKPINGVDRPAIATIVPTNRTPMLLIDSGCNVDSKPEWLFQYSKLANIYYKLMFNVDKPSIALLSVGTEENKGNALTLATYELLKSDKNLNFIGNVEARDLPMGACDIIVTDGFAGNVFLKTYEGTATLLIKLIKENIKSNLISMIGGLLIKNQIKKMLVKYDVNKYGGAPILGTNYLVIKCHGNAKVSEYTNTIKQAIDLIDNNIIDKIKNTMEV